MGKNDDSSEDDYELGDGMVRFGCSLGFDRNYDSDEEFRKPGYNEGPRVQHRTCRGKLKGTFTTTSVSRFRSVKERTSTQAHGPQGYFGAGASEEAFFLAGEGKGGEAECHVGPLGLGGKYLGVLASVEAGLDRGFDINAGARLVEGKVDVGPIKLGAALGVKGKVQAGCGGFGVMVPLVGGFVLGKDGLELGVGSFTFKIGF